MLPSDMLMQFAHNYLQIYALKDVIEISFFIFSIFKISTWLNKDHTKPLLLYFYAYFAVLFVTYFFQLSTVYQITIASAPIFFTLLIIHHQKNFQKNFIISQQTPLTPAKIYHKQWLEILIRACLVASHHKKNITCVIEQRDNLTTLLDKPFTLNITIQKQIIDMLLESVAYNQQKIIWVKKDGTLVSINASWSDLIVNELIFDQIPEEKLACHYAKVATSHTDALVFHINTAESTYNFIAHQGKIVENITIDQIIKLIKNILHQNTDLVKGTAHAQNESSSLTPPGQN